MTVKKAAALLVSAVAASAIGITAFAANGFSKKLEWAAGYASVAKQTKSVSGDATVTTSDGLGGSVHVVYCVYSSDGSTAVSNPVTANTLGKKYTIQYLSNCGFVGNTYTLKASLPPSNPIGLSTTVGGTWEP